MLVKCSTTKGHSQPWFHLEELQSHQVVPGAMNSLCSPSKAYSCDPPNSFSEQLGSPAWTIRPDCVNFGKSFHGLLKSYFRERYCRRIKPHWTMLSRDISVAVKFESNLKEKNFPLLSFQTSEKWKYPEKHKGNKDNGVVPCQQRDSKETHPKLRPMVTLPGRMMTLNTQGKATSVANIVQTSVTAGI